MTTGISATEYLDPEVDLTLPRRRVHVVDARDAAFAALASVATDPTTFEVPITPWPLHGRRPLDPGTGVEGGTVEGEFACEWQGDRLLATNAAVGGRYVIGCRPPAVDGSDEHRRGVVLWHLNHHPDGGQLFWSPDGRPFVVPAAPAGEDPDLDQVVALRSDGSFGICLHAGVWHDGVYPVEGDGRFRTRQGRVHARVSCSLGTELGRLLEIPLATPSH